VPLLALLTFAVIILFKGAKVSIWQKKIIGSSLVYFLIFCFIAAYANSSSEGVIFDWVKLALYFGTGIVVVILLPKADTVTVAKSFDLMVVCALVILLIECYLRLTSTEFNFQAALINAHAFKHDSPFFYDANAAAIFLIIHFSLFIYRIKMFNSNSKLLFLLVGSLFAILVLLTFSRAAIVVFALLVIYLSYSTIKIKIAKRASILLLFIMVLFLAPNVYELIESDLSGITKIEILFSMTSWWDQDIGKALFGAGINDGNYLYSYEEGKYSHATIPMVLGSFGLIGVILYFTFFLLVHSASPRALVWILPLFVLGLSYLPPFLESINLLSMIIASDVYRRGLTGR
jgi:hypothetical protein